MLVLLGPVGAGKSTALKDISDDCGGGVVHVRFDFQRDEPAAVVEVLAWLAFDLSRKWAGRGSARFLRFTLGLIAVLTPLPMVNRDESKRVLEHEINRVFPGRREIDGMVRTLTEAAVRTHIVTPVLAEAINAALPKLVRAVERQPLRRAGNWHADMRHAEGATSMLDALVTLNRQSSTQPSDMIAWLTEAFLADVTDSFGQMSSADLHSLCACDNPSGERHLHNWVVLLDNLHCPGGHEFVTNLLAARNSHLTQKQGDHDPLLVVASSGRWHPEWETDWLPPWKSSEEQGRARSVPRCRDADYRHWAENTNSSRPLSPYYPVLLEPLDLVETGAIVAPNEEMVANGSNARIRRALVQRATAGLPGRVYSLAAQLRGQELSQGSRNALHPSGLGASPESWRLRVADLQLTEHLPEIEIDDVVSAAPFATAPWLVHADSANLAAQADVGQILTELRAALWVVAPDQGGGTRDHAELHPWIARTLLAALAERSTTGDRPSYEEQFEALLTDPATSADPVRTAYCQLALGRITEVVDYFEAKFDDLPHQRWIDQLELVTSAPDRKPLDRDCAFIYADLVREDVKATGPNRTPVRNIVSRLVAARWLMANPFTTPAFELREGIVNSYNGLGRVSYQSGVAPLKAAADRAAKMF